ncbi:hypothetical protein IUJ58_20655 [Priestia aryabhattai]|uniref:hypothetical protein n=1 Tax=Priestia aryabhattai TaxID=412384 RepID=UPI001C0B84B9|nr:hypothetical protein [Priestia aryabhattai]MBU3573371.1 hypothetical protein [Priestia aryabhattai]WDL86337.1 hypothetical protein IUJ58_20655 [Priestia aryabhattai]
MNTVQIFFSKHPKWSYTGNFVVTLACVAVFPSLFMPTVSGVLFGFVAATAINYALGLNWKPLRELISK